MARSFLKVYFDFEERTEELNEIEKGRLLLAMLQYARTGEKPELKGNERYCFGSFKSDIDHDCEAYSAKVRNGLKGGRPAQTDEPNETENNLKKANETKNNLNQKIKNKNKNKTEDQEYIPPKSPQGFEEFWTVYPKKVGKAAAKKAFERVNVSLETLLTAIEQQKCSAQWSKDNGQYIPNPATWLNQGRWEDELEDIKTAQEPAGKFGGLKAKWEEYRREEVGSSRNNNATGHLMD